MRRNIYNAAEAVRLQRLFSGEWGMQLLHLRMRPSHLRHNLSARMFCLRLRHLSPAAGALSPKQGAFHLSPEGPSFSTSRG